MSRTSSHNLSMEDGFHFIPLSRCGIDEKRGNIAPSSIRVE
jgi:hypothetical protein